MKCLSVPDGYKLSGAKITVLVTSESRTYEVRVTVEPSASEPKVNAVTVTPDNMTIKKGATQQYAAVVEGENLADETVKWSVVGAASKDTQIDANGLLTVGADETSKQLVVKATSMQDSGKFGTVTVTVEQDQAPSRPAEPEQVQPTTPNTPDGDSGEQNTGSSPMLWILIGVIAVMWAVIVVLVLTRKKK
jgi:hypothetical protein